MAYPTALLIFLAASFVMVTATKEECERCYKELTDCTNPCIGDSWTLPPTCNDVECRKHFDSCWVRNCVIENDSGDDKGGEANTNIGVGDESDDIESGDEMDDFLEETDDGSGDIESNADSGEGLGSNTYGGESEENESESGESEDSDDSEDGDIESEGNNDGDDAEEIDDGSGEGEENVLGFGF